jgi:hypothetical protein
LVLVVFIVWFWRLAIQKPFLVIWDYLFFPLVISSYCVQAILGLFPCCIHTTLGSSMCRLPSFIFLRCSANV